jgi:AcrB/AcrD/AcrF family protein
MFWCWALIGIWARGLPSDIYFQVGLITVVGLAAKNAILIVEFANALRSRGHSLRDARENSGENSGTWPWKHRSSREHSAMLLRPRPPSIAPTSSGQGLCRSVGLEIDDVSFDRRTLTFRPNHWRRLKTHTSWRVVPLWPQLEAILRPYLDQRVIEHGGRLLFPSFTGGWEEHAG